MSNYIDVWGLNEYFFFFYKNKKLTNPKYPQLSLFVEFYLNHELSLSPFFVVYYWFLKFSESETIWTQRFSPLSVKGQDYKSCMSSLLCLSVYLMSITFIIATFGQLTTGRKKSNSVLFFNDTDTNRHEMSEFYMIRRRRRVWSRRYLKTLVLFKRRLDDSVSNFFTVLLLN